MIFGENSDKGLILDGFKLKVVDLNENSKNDILIHNVTDKNLAMLICEMTYDEFLPTPMGIFYKELKPTYDEMLKKQIEDQINSKGIGKLKDLIYTKNTWLVD